MSSLKQYTNALRFQVSLSVVAQGLGSLGMLALSILLARMLSQNDYGSYQQFQLVATTIVTLAIFGLPQSLYYYIPKSENPRRLVNRTLLISLLFCGVMSLGVLFFGRELSSSMNNQDIYEYSYLILLLAITKVPESIFEPVYISINRTKFFYILNIISTVIMFGVIAITLFASKSYLYLLYALILCRVLIFFVCFINYNCLIKRYQVKDVVDFISFRDQVWYSLPMGLSIIVGIIGKQIDKFVISAYFTPSDFAIYSRGSIDIPLIPIIVYSLSNVLMPKYIENYDSGNRKGMLDIWQKSVNYVALVNFPCFVLLFYFAKDLVILVYTEAYIASAPVFQGFLFLLLLQLTSYGGILRVTGKTSVILYATIITVPLNIVLAILLVQYYGFLGPVIATVACGLVGSLYMLRCIASIVEVKFHKIFPWSSLARTLMAALLSALILLPARKLGIENRLFIMIIEGCLYSLSFVAMAILLKAIPEKEYAFITSQFHSVRRFLFGSEHNVS